MEIRNYSRDAKYLSNIGDFKKGFELVLNCCFSSPVLHSLVITAPIRDNRAEFFSALARKLGPSLKIINFTCQRYETCYLEAFTNIIASHSQLTEVYLYFNIDRKVAASSLSYLYTSLIDFVQRPEFSKLYLSGQLPLSSHLRLLLDAFLKTPCSQPQEIHLYPREPACSELLPVDLPVGDNKVPSGALVYKYLIFHECSTVPVDFCEWLCSHQPLALKAFHFDAELVKIGEHNMLVQTSFPMQFLSDNTLFHRYVSVESSADMECFGDALYSLRNYEIFSLCIPVIWKEKDISSIYCLYKAWQKHGCRKLKSFQMGKFEYGFVLTDKLATKLDEMELVIKSWV